jgi:hypothetical protein
MLESVAAAVERRDFRTAQKLIVKALEEYPKEPMVHFYAGEIRMNIGKWEAAARSYQRALQFDLPPDRILKVTEKLSIANQKLLEEKDKQQTTLKRQATGKETSGLLILTSLPLAEKPAAAATIAEILGGDPFTIKLQIPSRGWRLYRSGSYTQLQSAATSLMAAGVPAFAYPLAKIVPIEVKQVISIESFQPEFVLNCTNEFDESEQININSAQVVSTVSTLLPIFEEVVENDPKTGTQRKPKILDYVPIVDLHIPDSQLILRICSENYDFTKLPLEVSSRVTREGLSFNTSRVGWDESIAAMQNVLVNSTQWIDFNTFADTAISFPEMLSHIPSHSHLLRRNGDIWDRIFHLYSCMAYDDIHRNN